MSIIEMPVRRLPPKCKTGKVCVVHVTKGGKRKVTYCKGVTKRGKKNLIFRKPQKQQKLKSLQSLAIIANVKSST